MSKNRPRKHSALKGEPTLDDLIKLDRKREPARRRRVVRAEAAYRENRPSPEELDCAILDIVEHHETPYRQRVRQENTPNDADSLLAIDDRHPSFRQGLTFTRLTEEMKKKVLGISCSIGDPSDAIKRHLLAKHSGLTKAEIEEVDLTGVGQRQDPPNGDLRERVEALLDDKRLTVGLEKNVEGTPTALLRLGRADADLSTLAGRSKRPPRTRQWAPPKGHVSTSDIKHSIEFRKDGKNPAGTTIQRWETSDPLKKKVKDPATGERWYPRPWATKHFRSWSPRKSGS